MIITFFREHLILVSLLFECRWSHSLQSGSLIERQLPIEFDYFINHFKLFLGSLIRRIDFESLLILVFGALIVAHGLKNNTPYDPILTIVWVHLDSLSNLVDRFCHFVFLEESKRPVSEAVVVAIFMMHVGEIANLDGLVIVAMHIIDECEIIVRKWVLSIERGTLFEMLDGFCIAFFFEI